MMNALTIPAVSSPPGGSWRGNSSDPAAVAGGASALRRHLQRGRRASAVPGAETKFCVNCGKSDSEANAKFCPECGASNNGGQ